MKLRRATVIVQATERRARRVVVLFLRQTVTTDPEIYPQFPFSISVAVTQSFEACRPSGSLESGGFRRTLCLSYYV